MQMNEKTIETVAKKERLCGSFVFFSVWGFRVKVILQWETCGGIIRCDLLKPVYKTAIKDKDKKKNQEVLQDGCN